MSSSNAPVATSEATTAGARRRFRHRAAERGHDDADDGGRQVDDAELAGHVQGIPRRDLACDRERDPGRQVDEGARREREHERGGQPLDARPA